MLALLLLRPEDALHGREIARRTGLPPGTLTRELRRLADVGLLEREQRGNQVVYRANPASPVFEELRSILRKTSGIADVLSEALAPLSDRIQTAIVFGSVARGTEQPGSDIDVLLIGEAKFRDVIEAFYPVQKRVGREINPKLFTPDEWKALRRKKNVFAAEVLRQPKIFLIGSDRELAQSDRKKS